MVAISLKSLINFLHKAIQEKKRNVCEILQCGSLDQMLADSKYLKEMYPEQSNAFDHLIYLLRSLAIEVDDSPVNGRRWRIERSAEEKEISQKSRKISLTLQISLPLKAIDSSLFIFRNFIPSLKMTSGGVRDSPNGRMWPKRAIISGSLSTACSCGFGILWFASPGSEESSSEFGSRTWHPRLLLLSLLVPWKLLLERPIQEVLKLENRISLSALLGEWGLDEGLGWRSSDVLVRQGYGLEDDRQHIRFLLQIFKDPRYIRIKGRRTCGVPSQQIAKSSRDGSGIGERKQRDLRLGNCICARSNGFPKTPETPPGLALMLQWNFNPMG